MAENQSNLKRSSARPRRQEETAGALNRAVRVMIVDDSITTRTVFSKLVEGDEDLALVAAARTAEEALDQLAKTPVDVILLDLEMPGMGGLRALPSMIKASGGAPILVVSSLTTDGAEQTLTALALGATDTFPKPVSGGFDTGYREMLLDRIRALGCGKEKPKSRAAPVLRRPATRRPGAGGMPGALAIGASTGGIHALGALLRALPPRLNIPIFITQHLPAAFMSVFCRQLMIASGREAVIAEEGMTPMPDQIIIAPGNAHLVLRSSGGKLVTGLIHTAVSSGCLPSVDPMFASLAESLGNRVVGVVLSGMGRDGTEGAAQIVRAGGTIYAQDEATSAVWGMPRAIADAGLASGILPPDQIASRIAAVMSSATWK